MKEIYIAVLEKRYFLKAFVDLEMLQLKIVLSFKKKVCVTSQNLSLPNGWLFSPQVYIDENPDF